MKDEELKRLIRLVEESQIDELEVRRFFTRVRITRAGALRRAAPVPETDDPVQAVAPPVPAAPAAKPSDPPPAEDGTVSGDEDLVPIVSPIVGTFYAAPSPDASHYVQLGSQVVPGQVVCIIEAMKLMNEIEAEVSGTIERVLVENAQPVEFNQPLFMVRPASSALQERREAS